MSFRVGGQEPREEEDRTSHSAEGTPMDYERDADGGGEEDEDVLVEDDDGGMAAMMGFGGFGTTKGKKVHGNNAGAVRKEKKTEYRQYMNRVGGFNRPLSPGR
jgi:U4/U6.U5 tri-snRNP-associated protein 3